MTQEQLEKGKELQRKIDAAQIKIDSIKSLKPSLHVQDSGVYHYEVPDEHAQALKDFLLSIEQKKLDQLQKEFDELWNS